MKKKVLRLIEEIKENIGSESSEDISDDSALATSQEEIETVEGEQSEETEQTEETVEGTQLELTDDPDISSKINDVINQVQFELARMKKIMAHTSQDVVAGEVFDLKTITSFYQLRLVRFKNTKGDDASYELIDNMVVFDEDGVANIFYYKYPEPITAETKDNYVFELSEDALEILPYGAAADILKSDVSTNYGQIYAQRYETMIQRLDSRYSTGIISVEGGVNI